MMDENAMMDETATLNDKLLIPMQTHKDVEFEHFEFQINNKLSTSEIKNLNNQKKYKTRGISHFPQHPNELVAVLELYYNCRFITGNVRAFA